MTSKKQTILIVGSNSEIAIPLIEDIRKRGDDLITVSRKTEGKIQTKSHFVMDLADKLDIEKLINNLEKFYFDAFIYFPGIFADRKIVNTKNKDVYNEINVNLNAAIIITSCIVKNMIKKRRGKLIYLGSSSAYQGFANSSVYCASKHGLLGFTRSLSEELRSENIRVTCVCPGTVNTKMANKLSIKSDPRTFIDKNELSIYISKLIYSEFTSFWQEEIIIKRRLY